MNFIEIKNKTAINSSHHITAAITCAGALQAGKVRSHRINPRQAVVNGCPGTVASAAEIGMQQSSRTYRLISFDMDGTLLNSDKKIDRRTVSAVRLAAAAGKIVVFGTGRCITELTEFSRQLPEIRYAICESGGLLYDFQEGKILYRKTFDDSLVRKILNVTQGRDTMIESLTGGQAYIQGNQLGEMDYYGLSDYKSQFSQNCVCVPDMRLFLSESPGSHEKINIYHATARERSRTRQMLSGLPLQMADSETTGLEITPHGISKGSGLIKLCEILGIPLEETIAVGDADNDLEILHTAGLGIAMGNANRHVREMCSAVVPDNNHGGCIQAITEYLL